MDGRHTQPDLVRCERGIGIEMKFQAPKKVVRIGVMLAVGDEVCSVGSPASRTVVHGRNSTIRRKISMMLESVYELGHGH